LKQKAKYFDCVSCKIPRLNLPDLADRPAGQSASSCSTLSTECDNDIEFVNKKAKFAHFEWYRDSFNDLSKKMSKKLLTMLKQDPDLNKKLLDVTIRQINERSKDAIGLFAINEDFSFCNDIEGLMAYLGFTHTNNDWCLFIDSSITSLKAALMYKSNLYPTLPFCYENVKEDRFLLKNIRTH